MSGASAIRLELLFLVQFFVNLLCLWFAGNISWAKPRWWRLLLVAALGAVLGVLPVVAPWGSWLTSGVGMVIVSVLLVLLLLWPCSFMQLLAVYGGFWIVLVITGGAVKLLVERSAPNLPFIPLLFVIAGVTGSLLGLQVVWQGYRERRAVRDSLRQVQIRLGDAVLVLTGLVDSGNSLRTPVSRYPVAVVEAERLRPHLPPEVMEALSMGWYALEAIPEAWRNRCQLVPYSAVGNQEGALLVITPGELAIWEGRTGRWVAVKGLIGLAMHPLGPQGHYQALLSPQMLQEAEGK